MTDKPTFSTKLLILGSGPAGCTAAIYAARANLNPVLLTGMEPGGQLTTTTDISNWPGEVAISGFELTDKMQKHAENMGTTIHYDIAVSVDFSSRPLTVTADQQIYLADSVIIATGAKAQYLGLASEQAYMGKGVSACAVCDGPFYRQKDIVIVGGGNTALTEAIYLANLASQVTLVHRRDTFRAEKILIDQLNDMVQKGNIKLELNSAIEEVLGDEHGVTGVKIRHLKTDYSKELSAAALFVAIGHLPATDIFTGQLDMEKGYILTAGSKAPLATATSVPGVFAAGDVQDNIYRQAITSAATGCMAALDAERFLSEQHSAHA